MRATIKQIAEVSGVSVTTVSLILNGKGERFAAETIARVEKVAKDLRYRPNKLAAGLITRRTNTIGLILPDIRNPFFAALAHGIANRAHELGYTMIQSNSSDSHERDLQIIEVMRSHLVDGLLFCMAGNTNEENFRECLSELQFTQVPFVLVDRFYPLHESMNIVNLDHEFGGYIATKHLIDLGHRKIACISGPLNLVDAKSRVKGYEKAMQEVGLDTFIVEGNYHSESGYKLTEEIFLNYGEDFTAVFACNDLMAMGVLSALDSLGKRVPEDVSVVGYDDIFTADLPLIKLSSVRQPVDDLGCYAVDVLVHELEPGHAIPEIELLPELIQRKTSKAIK